MSQKKKRFKGLIQASTSLYFCIYLLHTVITSQICPLSHPPVERVEYCTEKALAKLFPKEAGRLHLSFICPLIPSMTLLIKQSHHAAV